MSHLSLASPVTAVNVSCQAQDLLGRQLLLEEIAALLRRGHNVLLFGPPDVGKTALVSALTDVLAEYRVVTLDPFKQVTPHLAAQIRRAMDRGTQFVAATQSLDRKHLGAVRRIVWRFTTVRVPSLPTRTIVNVIRRACASAALSPEAATHEWKRDVARRSRGCPGLALIIVRAAEHIRVRKGALPSPAAAYVEARIIEVFQ